MHIALLGNEKDPQIQHVASAITQSGHQHFIINTSQFGISWKLSYDPDFNDGCIHFNHEVCEINQSMPQRITFSSTYSAYWHEYIAGEPITSSNQEAAYEQSWIEQEKSSAMLCWFSFNDIKWVNPIDAIRSHQCKPAQLRAAAKLGAKVPYTFTGNAADVATQFCNNMENVVYKPVRGGKTAQFVNKTPELKPLLTTLLHQRPVTFQKYIGGTNIRSYVLGSDVLSVEIPSTELDFRNDKNATPVITLVPKETQRLAVSICKALGMYWCAIDWRKSAKGTYFFLEANPSPFFMKVEKDTGLDITGRLVSLLTN